jgi:hypothetical protein
MRGMFKTMGGYDYDQDGARCQGRRNTNAVTYFCVIVLSDFLRIHTMIDEEKNKHTRDFRRISSNIFGPFISLPSFLRGCLCRKERITTHPMWVGSLSYI